MHKIRKLMLATPNCTWLNLRPWQIPPYTLGLLRAVIDDTAYEVEILDANLENLTFEQVRNRVHAFGPDLVGVSTMSLEYAKSGHKMIELVKHVDPQILTVMGGVYGTISPEMAIHDPNLDFVILGEGERRFPKLLNILNEKSPDFSDFDGLAYRSQSQVVINPIKTYIEDLDSLPFPAYDKVNFTMFFKQSNKFSNVLLPRYYPYTITSTSRGCPFNCIYCSTHAIDGKRIRYKSAERVLEEIDWLVREYGIKEIIFLDDNLVLNRERFVNILKGLIARDYDLFWKSVNLATFMLDEEILALMKESKTYQIILPIESGNQHVLSNILKKPLDLTKVPAIIDKAKSLDLEIAADFIIGVPGETWDQIQDTIRFAEAIDVDMVSFHIATPLPKTALYELAKERGNLDMAFDVNNLFGFGRGHITTDQFTPKSLHTLRATEWARINFATQHKRQRFANMAGISLEELETWRQKTLEHAGIFFPEASFQK
ncbi:radical SAM protein [candidate division KSB3 bacterium]|uniref:Radical SAM protein n=1 Tax=candidate division KSB3 bacterium TaxID=2044937 RepID=A0A9D5JY24_9BACT|nr:radical SAM protein [candidate division KSB3 bacterium]MBD3326076.1 radical SAM protein [candidate division KSB3 bacterium]